MKNKMKFIVLSLLGLILYIFPFTIGGETTVMISHFTNFVVNNLSTLMNGIIFVFVIGTIIGSGLSFFIKDFKSETLNGFFKHSNLQSFLQLFGSIAYLMVFFQVGPEFIIGADTGLVMLDLVFTLYITFFAGVMLMPLLTNFGAVEFFGVLVAPMMRKLFRVPGFAAIDATASFVGDGTLGIVVTDRQYQNGYYTQKEAAIIATTFSIVGIAFAGAVAQELGFGSIFGLFYLSIFVTTIIVAFIMARIPFKKFKDEYYTNEANHSKSELEKDRGFAHAMDLACKQAENSSVAEGFGHAFKSVISIYITFTPVIMFVGTVGLIVAVYTPIFSILAAPIVPIFTLLGFNLVDAQMMAPALLVGLADMYLPTIFILESTSQAAKFFVGVMSFTQLIFLSETGMILVKSKLGFNFLDIIKVYFLRTILAFPIVMFITYLFVNFNII